ncbi:hypothetical protein SAMN05216223_116118 [Actinacidiphila yanglinensis]|uniref:Uncharacterized protein n=1 Tax=Actinacidiphila yanglinensis TaxID=310779 RepID=A0A1H6DLH1_9ACTN|nr:hypothetical protein [Actinacidiphila yanglinensis]SEG85683.1 hypothetical protein SAMN05216223_116118 [Actinacidiphila yanglinensis]
MTAAIENLLIVGLVRIAAVGVILGWLKRLAVLGASLMLGGIACWGVATMGTTPGHDIRPSVRVRISHPAAHGSAAGGSR